MKKNTTKVLSYALTISMLFSSAVVNSKKSVAAIAPSPFTVEEPEKNNENKKLKLKKYTI